MFLNRLLVKESSLADTTSPRHKYNLPLHTSHVLSISPTELAAFSPLGVSLYTHPPPLLTDTHPLLLGVGEYIKHFEYIRDANLLLIITDNRILTTSDKISKYISIVSKNTTFHRKTVFQLNDKKIGNVHTFDINSINNYIDMAHSSTSDTLTLFLLFRDNVFLIFKYNRQGTSSRTKFRINVDYEIRRVKYTDRVVLIGKDIVSLDIDARKIERLAEIPPSLLAAPPPAQPAHRKLLLLDKRNLVLLTKSLLVHRVLANKSEIFSRKVPPLSTLHRASERAEVVLRSADKMTKLTVESAENAENVTEKECFYAPQPQKLQIRKEKDRLVIVNALTNTPLLIIIEEREVVDWSIESGSTVRIHIAYSSGTLSLLHYSPETNTLSIPVESRFFPPLPSTSQIEVFTQEDRKIVFLLSDTLSVYSIHWHFITKAELKMPHSCSCRTKRIKKDLFVSYYTASSFCIEKMCLSKDKNLLQSPVLEVTGREVLSYFVDRDKEVFIGERTPNGYFISKYANGSLVLRIEVESPPQDISVSRIGKEPAIIVASHKTLEIFSGERRVRERVAEEIKILKTKDTSKTETLIALATDNSIEAHLYSHATHSFKASRAFQSKRANLIEIVENNMVLICDSSSTITLFAITGPLLSILCQCTVNSVVFDILMVNNAIYYTCDRGAGEIKETQGLAEYFENRKVFSKEAERVYNGVEPSIDVVDREQLVELKASAPNNELLPLLDN